MGGLSLLGTCGKETEMTFTKDVCMDIHSSFTGRSPVLQTTPASSHGRTDRRLRANSPAGRCDEIKQEHGNLTPTCVSSELLHFLYFFFFNAFYFIFYFIYLLFFGCTGLCGCTEYSQITASGGYSSLQCPAILLQWQFLLQSTGSKRGFSNSGSWAGSLWCSSFIALRHVKSSQTRD